MRVIHGYGCVVKSSERTLVFGSGELALPVRFPGHTLKLYDSPTHARSAFDSLDNNGLIPSHISSLSLVIATNTLDELKLNSRKSFVILNGRGLDGDGCMQWFGPKASHSNRSYDGKALLEDNNLSPFRIFPKSTLRFDDLVRLRGEISRQTLCPSYLTSLITHRISYD